MADGWVVLSILGPDINDAGGLATLVGYTPRSRLFGWIFFVAGASVAVMTVNKWAQVLPGIFGVATLNSLMILITGHALNQPSVPVSRWIGLLLTAVMVSASVVTSDFAGRRLTKIDNATCFGILSCLVAMIVFVMGSVSH